MPKTTFSGVVTSDKMLKTVTVSVDIFKRHPIYNKSIRNTKKFMARNEDFLVKIGDVVTIESSRPYSKNVKWKVINKLENK